MDFLKSNTVKIADKKKTEIIYPPTTTDRKNINLDSELESKKINFSLYFVVFCVNLQSFAAGNAYGWSSTALIELKSNDTLRNPLGQSITSLEESGIVSLLSLGAAIGTLFSGYCSRKFGKKNTLLLFGMPMLISNVLLVFANTVELILVARFLVGLGIGCANPMIPIYVAEISEIQVRGLLVCVMGVLFSAGVIAVFTVGAFVNVTTLSLLLTIPPALFLFLFGYYCPESPYYYLIDNDIASAKKSLNKLRNNDSDLIEQELADIKEFIQESKREESLGKALKAKKFRKAIIITVTLMFFQQLVGATVVMSYLGPILSTAGGSISSSISSIIISVICLVSVVLSIFFIDRLGRKIFLVIGCLSSSFSLISLGLFFYLQNVGTEVKHLSWVPLLSLIVYAIGFSLGLDSIPWVLTGELFSNKTKELASSLTFFMSVILGFITTLIFPTLNNVIGLHGSFWLMAGNSIICMLFVMHYVPETKGKTFQDILRILEK